ncbi:MAG: hypothetical protein U0Y10_05770 [Spirosomataceae bacterium]
MRLILGIIISWIVTGSVAQSLEGTWYGEVTNSGASMQSQLILKVSANKQVTGEQQVFSNGVKDIYTLSGNSSNGVLQGKLTYKDGAVFDVVLQLQTEILSQKIYYNGQLLLEGRFSKNKSASASTTTQADGLYRDPKLVGKWIYSENYSSSGGYYGGVSSAIVLQADGSVDDGGATSYANGGGNSVTNQGGGNQTIAQLKALGAKWFTKGNIFCWRIIVNGKTTDVESSKYYLENNALLLTDLKTGKKTLYTR